MAVNGSKREDGTDRADESAEDDLRDGDDRPAKRSLAVSRPPRRRLPFIVGGVVVVAAVAVTAVLVTSGSSKSKSGTTPKSNATFTTFEDKSAGIALSYPPSWTAGHAAAPNVLQLSFGQDGLDTMLLQVLPIAATVNTDNEAAIKSVTDAVISGTGVTVLKQQAVTVGGLLGYYYFYTLPPAAGVTLVHSHFFVFPDHKMVIMLFQTVSQDFTPLATTFDQVVSSFHTIPTS